MPDIATIEPHDIDAGAPVDEIVIALTRAAQELVARGHDPSDVLAAAIGWASGHALRRGGGHMLADDLRSLADRCDEITMPTRGSC